jgi:tripartite-type tricarboxylate transporter receptor subunit TctC
MSILKKAAVAAVLTVGLATSAFAQYPSGPVQFIVPWPPGDFEDVLTRMIAAEMSEQTGVSAAVVNKPGGGDGPFPGALEVLAAPADGSVVGSFVIGVPVVGPLIDIGIDMDSFEPIGIFLTYPFILAAKGDVPYKNMAELAEYAKSNDVVLGHFGAGLAPTKATMASAKALGFEFADDSAFDNVDCNTLASGDADVVNTTLSLIAPCLDEITVLANIGTERINKLPHVPTLAEQVPGMDFELWNGLFVKKGTPQDVKDKLAEIAKAAVLGEAAQALAASSGAGVYWKDAAASMIQIEADRAKLKEINGMLAD